MSGRFRLLPVHAVLAAVVFVAASAVPAPLQAQTVPPVEVTHQLSLKKLALKLAENETKAGLLVAGKVYEGEVLGVSDELIVIRYEPGRHVKKIAYFPFKKIDAILLYGKLP